MIYTVKVFRGKGNEMPYGAVVEEIPGCGLAAYTMEELQEVTGEVVNALIDVSEECGAKEIPPRPTGFVFVSDGPLGGGKRRGAGRKRLKEGEESVSLSVRVPESVKETVAEYGLSKQIQRYIIRTAEKARREGEAQKPARTRRKPAP